jgi:polyhydroxybutyrate depolymerase
MKLVPIFLLPLLILALVRFPLASRAAQSATPPQEKQWTVDDATRTARLYVPANATREKVPVVFVFHGHGGSITQADRSFGMQKEWPEAIVVYMQGLNTPGQLTDPNGTRPGWQAKPGDQKDRDLKFFDAVLASLKKDYKVDETRVFATGHSNGGSFTYLLWATRPKIFRAVAPSSAIPGSFASDLTPKPVLHLAGETDPLVRYAWQQRTFGLLKKLNDCSPDGTTWAKSGPLTGTKYTSKTGNPLITLLHPGGHRFPAEAPALIVRFFKESSAK